MLEKREKDETTALDEDAQKRRETQKTKKKRKHRRALVPIYTVLTRFPGGNILIPMLIGCLIVTIASLCGHEDIWAEIGDPMQTMFSGKEGLLAFIGLMIFFTGTQTDVRNLKPVLNRGLPILAVRLGIAYALSFGFLFAFGEEGFWGISFLSFTAAMTCINSALFMSITHTYADDADRAYFSLAMIFGLPVFPLLAVRAGTGASIDYISVISIVVPMAFGMLLGNLDNRMKKYYEFGNQVIVMFMGFQFGSYIDLTQAFRQLPQALLVTLMVYGTHVFAYLLERFAMRRSGYATTAMSAVAGVGLTMPVLTSDIFSETITTNATYQLAFALAVTALLAPLLTDWTNRNFYSTHPDRLKLTCPALYAHVERQRDQREQSRELRYFSRRIRVFSTPESTESLSQANTLLACVYSPKLKRMKDAEFKVALQDLPKELRHDQKIERLNSIDDRRSYLESVSLHVARERIEALAKLERTPVEDIPAMVEEDPLLDRYRKRISRKLRIDLPELSREEEATRLMDLYDRAAFRIDMEQARTYIDSSYA